MASLRAQLLRMIVSSVGAVGVGGTHPHHTHTHENRVRNSRETREKRALIAIVGAEGPLVCRDKRGPKPPSSQSVPGFGRAYQLTDKFLRVRDLGRSSDAERLTP